MYLYMPSSDQQFYQKIPLFAGLFLLGAFYFQIECTVCTPLLGLPVLLQTFCQAPPHIQKLSFQNLQILLFVKVCGPSPIEL